jgi:long-chain acyl-CoA synthetase
VGIHLPNCPQYPIAYYAVLSLGATVVNLNPMYTAEELKLMATVTGMTTLITFDTALAAIRTLYKELKLPRIIVTQVADFMKGMGVSTAASLDLEKGWHHFSTLMEGCSSTKRPRIQIDPAAPALIQFTGGTTGIPKGAVLTHANVVTATLLCTVWGSTTHLTTFERRNVIAMLPYFHVYGNIVVMNWAVFNCATQIQMPRFEIDEMINLLANFAEISFFPTVPTLINALINHPRAMELNLAKKLKLLNSGAAPIPVELIDQIRDMGIFFTEGYGLNESSSLGISNPIL